MNLILCFSSNPMQLFNYVRQCLATEVRLIQAVTGEILTGLPLGLQDSSTTDVVRKLDVLKQRTRVSCFNLLFLFLKMTNER